MINIIVNGREWMVPIKTNLEYLISRLKIHHQTYVIEVNGEIVGREDFCIRLINDGDVVEIIRFMAGG